MLETRDRTAGTAVRARLPDGRWHFQQGPIDLIIGADGDAAAIDLAVDRAWLRFQSILTELARELGLLRSPVEHAASVRGLVARRMVEACWPHRAQFITPMAAVAGSVADELIGFFRDEPGVTRAYVNNGGDIALHLASGQRYRVGLYADLGRIKRRELPALDGDLEVTEDMRVRGVATSGWHGRSFSLGIADSVTVLAATGAAADAAATMIANEVNVDDAAIVRRPACEIKDDTDLGERLVTVDVGRLPERKISEALDHGVAHAQRLSELAIVAGAVLWLQGNVRVVGTTRLPVRVNADRGEDGLDTQPADSPSGGRIPEPQMRLRRLFLQ